MSYNALKYAYTFCEAALFREAVTKKGVSEEVFVEQLQAIERTSEYKDWVSRVAMEYDECQLLRDPWSLESERFLQTGSVDGVSFTETLVKFVKQYFE